MYVIVVHDNFSSARDDGLIILDFGPQIYDTKEEAKEDMEQYCYSGKIYKLVPVDGK